MMSICLRIRSSQVLVCVLFAPLGPPLFGVSCPGAQANEEASLILLEQNWAQALELHNSETVSCILGDEFEDADVNGQVHNARFVSGHRFSDAEEQLTAPPLGAGLVLYAECFVEERNLGRRSFLNCSEGCSQCEP
jgi:hypothetical protein